MGAIHRSIPTDHDQGGALGSGTREAVAPTSAWLPSTAKSSAATANIAETCSWRRFRIGAADYQRRG